MKWERSAVIENLLRTLNIPYHYEPELPLASIDLDRGLSNQARFIPGAIDPETVLKYAIDMHHEEAAFPAIIAYKNCTKYVPTDGNQRLAGFVMFLDKSQDGATVGAYIIDTDDDLQIRLATTLPNSRNGLQQSRDEAVQHVLSLLDSYPSSVNQSYLGKMFGVNQSLISAALRARNILSILKERRVKNAASLGRTALCEIGKLLPLESVVAVAGDIAIRHELQLAQIKDMVSAAKGQRSETNQINALEKYEDSVATKPRPSQRQPQIKANFYRALNALIGIVAKNTSFEALQITSKSEREEARATWERLQELMEKIAA